MKNINDLLKSIFNNSGECPYEHIPDGLQNPRDILRKTSALEIINAIEKRKKEEAESDNSDDEVPSSEYDDADELETFVIFSKLAEDYVNGTLPPEIKPGSDFYMLIEAFVKENDLRDKEE
jgi:hypothetical protein